jgi:hypothetical protein
MRQGATTIDAIEPFLKLANSSETTSVYVDRVIREPAERIERGCWLADVTRQEERSRVKGARSIAEQLSAGRRISSGRCV